MRYILYREIDENSDNPPYRIYNTVRDMWGVWFIPSEYQVILDLEDIMPYCREEGLNGRRYPYEEIFEFDLKKELVDFLPKLKLLEELKQ